MDTPLEREGADTAEQHREFDALEVVGGGESGQRTSDGETVVEGAFTTTYEHEYGCQFQVSVLKRKVVHQFLTSRIAMLGGPQPIRWGVLHENARVEDNLVPPPGRKTWCRLTLDLKLYAVFPKA